MPDSKNPVADGAAQQSGPETPMDPSVRNADNVMDTNHGENSSNHPYMGNRGHEDPTMETNSGQGSAPRADAANIQPSRPNGDGEDLQPRSHRNAPQPEGDNQAGTDRNRNGDA